MYWLCFISQDSLGWNCQSVFFISCHVQCFYTKVSLPYHLLLYPSVLNESHGAVSEQSECCAVDIFPHNTLYNCLIFSKSQQASHFLNFARLKWPEFGHNRLKLWLPFINGCY